MAQRNSLQPGLRRGIVAGVLAALSSLMHRGQPAIARIASDLDRRAKGVGPSVNWLKASLISQKYASGARGG